jgi:pimeloyl-ACP methyl ester carboxylesterase
MSYPISENEFLPLQHADKQGDPGSSDRLLGAEPRTIVLIHGLWMTPRSWEPFRRYYEERRYRVLAPPWPRLGGEVEEIRRDPSELAGLSLAEIAAHYEQAVRRLDEAPILIGHSLGDLVVQMLLDRGLGAAGVAIGSAPPKGVCQLPPLSEIKALLPVVLNPLSYWQTVSLSYRQFRYAFANTMSENEARTAFAWYTIPAPGRPVFEVTFANLSRSITAVNYANGERAPLLLIAATNDHIIPATMVKSNYHKYRCSKAITSFKEFPGHSHMIIAQNGWQQVAEFALSWVQQNIPMGYRSAQNTFTC